MTSSSPAAPRWRTPTQRPATISVVPASLWRPNGNLRQPPKRHLSLVMMMEDRKTALSNRKEEAIRPTDDTSSTSQMDHLRFDRLQPSEGELECKHKRAFGRFVAREAVIDEEYWTAAWLRAESNWEDRLKVQHAESFKRQFAQREFAALKRRCNSQLAEKCTCIVAVKREEMNVKHNILSSIVGSLDLSIRHFKCALGDLQKHISPVISSIYKTDQLRYGYVANVCVSKYARRQGIASNMLQLAIEAAKSYGVCQIFVHVHKDNMAAQKLYDQIGFQMVEMTPHSVQEQNYLMCFQTFK